MEQTVRHNNAVLRSFYDFCLDRGDGPIINPVRLDRVRHTRLPASSEAFVWIRLYLADLGTPLDLQDPLWWTLRRRPRAGGPSRSPSNYEALRAVFRRVNRLLGTNWSMHDLRHTAALRMSRDDALSLRDVQTILGHAHASTTADVYLVEQESQVIRRVQRHLARPKPPNAPPTGPEAAYDSDDLQVLFSGRLS